VSIATGNRIVFSSPLLHNVSAPHRLDGSPRGSQQSTQPNSFAARIRAGKREEPRQRPAETGFLNRVALCLGALNQCQNLL
jgi:hypothetical protein